jgi:hypothetical protein
LGRIAGADRACCGHGETRDAHVGFISRMTLRGPDAIEFALAHDA